MQPPDALETDFERSLPQALRGRVKPVDIARRLAQEMTDRAAETPTGVYAPNEFAVVLSPEDMEHLQPFEASLASQFADHLTGLACARDFRLLGPARVGFEADEALSPGQFEVESRIADVTPQQPSFDRLTGEEAGLRAFIRVCSGVDQGASMALSSPSVTIGRGLLCDLRLTDPAVARRHARIALEAGSYVLSDLGSASGTFVGSERVQSRPLADGDLVRLGNTTLEFRLRS